MKSVATVLLALGLPAAAQVVTEMSPDAVAQAIDAGLARAPRRYEYRTPKLWLQCDTPFLRVAMAAADAQQKAIPIDGSLITPELTAPELRITLAPELTGDEVPGIKAIAAQVGNGPLVAPLRSEPVVDYAQSRRRKKIELRGVKAVFPVSVLQPGVKFRLTMTKGPEQALAPDAAWFQAVR